MISNYFLIIFLVVLFHLFFINNQEKLLFANENNSEYKPICNNVELSYYESCYGLPEKYIEILMITIILIITIIPSEYYYTFSIISVIIVILVIFLKINSYMNNLYQIIITILIGSFYGLLYSFFIKDYIKLIFLVIFIYIFLTILAMFKFNTLITSAPIPQWVSKNLYPDYERKMNTIYKYQDLLLLPYLKYTYTTWKSFEILCDSLYSKILDSGNKPDVVVGIKTGGAFLANYIGYKYNIPYTYIKIKPKFLEGGNKNFSRLVKDDIFENYEITEAPTINLTDPNITKILIIDELIMSGNTVNSIINHLKKQGVDSSKIIIGSIYRGSLKILEYKKKNINFGSIPYFYILEDGYTIWPWGFDN